MALNHLKLNSTIIRAAVCREFGQPLSVEKILLAPPKSYELKVKLAACAICHSDISAIKGIWNGSLPAVYGHEASGFVTQVGKKIKDFKPGDRVLVSLIRACGDCELCRENEPTSCLYAYDEEPSPLKDFKNEVIFKGMKTGAFADHVVVSAEQCVKVPNELPLDEASLLSCGVLTGYGSVFNTAKLKTGQSVVVIGSGGVGLNTIQAARIKSASHIIAIDISNKKLKIARNFGATATVKASGQSIEDTVKSLTNGLGVNYVFVTVGDPEAFLYAPSLLKSGGSIVLVGLPQSGTQVPYDAMKLSAMNQSILGSRMGKGVLSRDIPKLIKLWKAGKLQLRELISKKFELNQINEAIRNSSSGKSKRNIIIF